MDDDMLLDIGGLAILMDQWSERWTHRSLYMGYALVHDQHYDSQVGADGNFTPYFSGMCYGMTFDVAHEIIDEQSSDTVAYNTFGSTSEDLDMGKFVAHVNS